MLLFRQIRFLTHSLATWPRREPNNRRALCLKRIRLKKTHLLGKVIAKGKTKQVVVRKDPGLVEIVFNDDVVVDDGKRVISFRGKGNLAAATAVSVFRILNAGGVRTSFHSGVGHPDQSYSFRAQQVTPIPIKVEVLRCACGTHLSRYPTDYLGKELGHLRINLFSEDVSRVSPPLTIVDDAQQRAFYFHRSKPFKSGFIKEEWFMSSDVKWLFLRRVLDEGCNMAKSAFAVLSLYFIQRKVELQSLEVQFGINQFRDLVIIGSITNDSWRLWPRGNPSRALDKHVVEGKVMRPMAEQDLLLKNYIKVRDLVGG